MAHRLLSTARKLERLLWNGVKRGNIDTNLVGVIMNFQHISKKYCMEVRIVPAIKSGV
jgi:hypothetical protein